MIDFIAYICSGAIVGFLVGLTGVGGGSLMTPLLLLFGFPPATAIGTDLLYASLTKASGVFVHVKQKTVNWKIALLLGLGSVPGALITIVVLNILKQKGIEYTQLLTVTLGVMLVLTSLVILFRSKLTESPRQAFQAFHAWVNKHRSGLTVTTGLLLGVMVTLSSVGAGAFGAAALMLLYPKMNAVKIVGTDLAHAVPLTAIAGIGHMQLGHVDYQLLFALLIGSIPAITVGSKLAYRLPNNVLQPTLAWCLLFLGVKYSFF